MTASRKYELLLTGGTLLDPGQNIHARRDVAFKDGRVAMVADRIDPADATQVVDIRDKLVTPGLIDIHGHFYHGGTWGGADADETCLPSGVTTAVDAGSAGWANYRAMRDYVFRDKRTRLMAFLHIAGAGLVPQAIVGGELQDLRYADPDRTAETISQDRSFLVGVKIRMHAGAIAYWDARPALRRAREAADKAGVRLMVHVAGTPIPLVEILDTLKPGDIATHILNGLPEGILSRDGTVIPEVRAAADRGVVMDVAHAGARSTNFDIDVCRGALRQGFIPTTLSTDMHKTPNSTAYGQHELISMFHAMGLPLQEAVAASTVRPARALGLEGQIGSLAPGMMGDAAVFDQQEGSFTWRDRVLHTIEGNVRLETLLTIKDGVVVWRHDRFGPQGR